MQSIYPILSTSSTACTGRRELAPQSYRCPCRAAAYPTEPLLSLQVRRFPCRAARAVSRRCRLCTLPSSSCSLNSCTSEWSSSPLMPSGQVRSMPCNSPAQPQAGPGGPGRRRSRAPGRVAAYLLHALGDAALAGAGLDRTHALLLPVLVLLVDALQRVLVPAPPGPHWAPRAPELGRVGGTLCRCTSSGRRGAARSSEHADQALAIRAAGHGRSRGSERWPLDMH